MASTFEPFQHKPGQALRALKGIIQQELKTPIDEKVLQFVHQLIDGEKVRAVLFYGSGLWGKKSEDTVYDFYILTEKLSDWPARRAVCWAGEVLPPNVEYHEGRVSGHVMRAKVAIMTVEAFRRKTALTSWDTTIWARFSQPVRLAYVADDEAYEDVTSSVLSACCTAAIWGGFLCRDGDSLDDVCRHLYKATYCAELRVEKKGRSTSIVDVNPKRYVDILCLVWGSMGYVFETRGKDPCWPRNIISPSQRARVQKRWKAITRFGAVLNFLRLVKASYTFQNGARYILWKIERHTNVKFTLTPFREKHPVLASLPILYYLWRQKKIHR